jgi:hypothetical protein
LEAEAAKAEAAAAISRKRVASGGVANKKGDAGVDGGGTEECTEVVVVGRRHATDRTRQDDVNNAKAAPC